MSFASMETHIILLLQQDNDPRSRVWSDHCSLQSAIEYILGVYMSRKDVTLETLDFVQFAEFFDSIYDCVPLVYDSHFRAYVPFEKKWLLARIDQYLKIPVKPPYEEVSA
ncbi:hypothetical protein SJAG_01867 [Schizosaccharomyces japonicus yFS275]|uniref:Enhancer of rudimentary-like protein n=2 Tax=Schizosaccharomyces japonicus TaxID=4897 RepID=B6JZ43_SCHJY|nr:hypothetical protein SJAG_01867 [Schizosaccharomyces japonicus yFS275]AFK79847.1 enhancer of rudimentary-like protein [Schizosaccharomyces japonicus]AFK79851.1 enhancer of rudimentary-like protein [Schizosaccharomyces japonicus]EEB06811.1 hypothetical protein SJAG_01867 [Schizosaccharomyces japonicus yFS275]